MSDLPPHKHFVLKMSTVSIHKILLYLTFAKKFVKAFESEYPSYLNGINSLYSQLKYAIKNDIPERQNVVHIRIADNEEFHADDREKI